MTMPMNMKPIKKKFVGVNKSHYVNKSVKGNSKKKRFTKNNPKQLNKTFHKTKTTSKFAKYKNFDDEPLFSVIKSFDSINEIESSEISDIEIPDIEIRDFHFEDFMKTVQDPVTTNPVPKSLDFLKNNLQKVKDINNMEELKIFQSKAE